MSANKRLGRWLLYGLCLAPAVLMLGYYFLEYIPAQREYFMNLRFRALAILGDQFRTKVEGLASSLKYATGSDRQPDSYISALVPELNYQMCKPDAAHPPSVEFGQRENAVRFDSGRGCPAEASLSQIFSRFSHDDLFDDIVIAEAGGRVIYQRSTSSPRAVNLSELRKTASDTNPIWREGTGTDADAVRNVRLDDSDYVLLLQPVRISMFGMPPAGLMAGGLVRAQRLADEARHVPPKYLLVIFAPLAILLLSGPFLKILLLTRTGRLAFRDIALLSLFAMIAAGLATLVMISWHQYGLSERQSEAEMRQFGKSLNQQIASDVEQMRNTLERFDDALPADIGKTTERDRTDLLASGLPVTTIDPIPFDFVFWTNADGCQIAKWTTKRFNTQRVDQTPEEHFQNVMARRLWSIKGNEKTRFTLQTLISPTTSQLIVVMAIPTKHASISVQGCADPMPSNIVSAAIVAPLRSLSGPLVPPGVGFAILEPGGRVLFHSASERNLHENLFEEIHSPAALRAAVAMRADQSVSAYYRGRQYQFNVQPVTGLGGIPWTIAVFRELEPRQALMGLVWGETLALLLALLCLMVAAFVLFSAILRAGWKLSWRREVDFIFARVWPDPARRPVFRRLAWELGALVLLSVIVIIIGAMDSYRFTGWLLPFCFLVPIAAVALTAFRFRKSDPASWNVPPTGQKQPAYIACLSLLLVLLAVVPTLGLFGICQAFETRLQVMHWQQDLLSSVDARRSRLAAEVEGSRALTDPAKAFIRERFLTAKEAAGGWDRQGYPKAFSQTEIGAPTAQGKALKPSRWQSLLTDLRPEAEANAMETGALARGHAGSSACLWYGQPDVQPGLILRCIIGSATPVELRSMLPATEMPSDPLWWVVALVLLGSAYAWNCLAFSRLFNLDFDYIPLPRLTEVPGPAAVRGHLLVLGLPLARKDAAVRGWLRYTPPRVNLYEECFSGDWLEATCVRLKQELSATPGKVMQAAAGGITVPAVRTASIKPWVHISNLEAKLNIEQERQVVAALMERLIMMEVGDTRVRLIITSNVDPVFHFDSVLSDERKKIYEHPMPEPELQRWARLLHNFRKLQLPTPDGERPEWAGSEVGAIVYAECQHHQALLSVGEEVAASAPPGTESERLLAMVAERSLALYKLYWASCTRSEKLLLIQLAQTGLVNPLCLDTLADLVRKGLILPGPRPRIMNETFQRFLETVEGPDAVREWESEAGESSWLIIRNVVLVLIVLGLAVLALTQHQALQTVTAVLTGIGTVMAGLFRLLGYLTGRRSEAAESPAEPA